MKTTLIICALIVAFIIGWVACAEHNNDKEAKQRIEQKKIDDAKRNYVPKKFDLGTKEGYRQALIHAMKNQHITRDR